jgi:hypothetical protein
MSTASARKRRDIAAPTAQSAAVVLGRLAGMTDTGEPLVHVTSEDVEGPPVPARTLVQVTATHMGREVALQFIDGDLERPLVVGLLVPESGRAGSDDGVRITAEAGSLRLSARQEIVLECGPARITLRRDGQLRLRAESILSRATGVHRIRGGSVQLN